MDVWANIAILTKTDSKKQQFWVPFLDPKMAQNIINFLVFFDLLLWGQFLTPGADF